MSLEPRTIGDLEVFYRKAMFCRRCFEQQLAVNATVDLPQPDYVGSEYFRSLPRLLLFMVNPGAGSGMHQEENRIMQEHLNSFKTGASSYVTLRDATFADMVNWGSPKGRFVRSIEMMGVNLRQVAVVNVAHCAVHGDKPSRAFLTTCYENITKALLIILAPQIVVLLGKKTHFLSKPLTLLLPQSIILETIHYASYISDVTKEMEWAKIRASVERFKKG